jgi:hypothetical protein
MLTPVTAPDYFTPNQMGQPAVWSFQNPDYLTVIAQPNTYVLRVTSIGSNAEAFTLAGVDFTTSDASDYSSTTFDHTNSIFRSALNLANALRSNASFRGYTVRTARPSNGQPWRVIVKSVTEADATAAELDNDFAGLTGVTVEQINGRTEQTQAARLWYQFWGPGGPISPELFAPFDQNGAVAIDARQAARRIINPAPPDIDATGPTYGLNDMGYVSLKYGTYQTDGNCDPVFGSAAETPPAPFIDAVLQYDQNSLQQYGPGRTGPLKWLTRRANQRTVNTYGFEWSAIYLGPSPFGLDAPRRLVREFFNAAGDSLGVINNDMNGLGLWRVPTGYQNAVPDGLDGAASFTVQVQQDGFLGWVAESETLTITAAVQGCRAAEIYYLEGLGSWGTMQFKELNERGLAMTAEGWQRPVLHDAYSSNPTGNVLYNEGGNYQRVTDSATTMTVTSYRIPERKRKQVEEMLESPAAYLLTETEAGQIVTRRITFARESYRVAQDEGRATVSVSFSFAQPRRLR